MKKNMVFLFSLFVLLAPLSGCYTINSNIGSGAPNGTPVAEDRQWFILWGLLPLNNVDAGQMAQAKGLQTNYTIQSQQSLLDVILNFFTGIVTVYSRDIKVLASGNSGSSAAAPSSGNQDYVGMGNQAMMSKDYNGALTDYQNAANANPNSAAAYQGMGTAYYYLGQKDKAINAYETALQLDPSNTRLANFLNTLKGGQ